MKLPYYRGQRRPPRRLDQAQPLRLPARHHRREEPDPGRWRRGSRPMSARRSRMIFPDFAFGYDHRDYLPPALKAQGAEVIAQIAIPPTESSFTKYFPQIPADTDVIYHVMVGPGGADLRQGTRRVLRLEPAAALRLHRLARGGRHQQPRPGIPRRQPFLGRLAALCAGRRQRRAEGLSRRRRHRRQWRRGRRPEGHLDRRPHVRLLGDALRHQEGDGGRRLPRAATTAPSWSRRPRR